MRQLESDRLRGMGLAAYLSALLLGISIWFTPCMADPDVKAEAPVRDPAQDQDKPAAKKIVYVVQASGSMMAVFDDVRVQLKSAVTNLHPPQVFNIVFIKEKENPTLAEGLLFATPENKKKAAAFIDDLAPRDHFDPLPAIAKAFEMEPQVVYLLINPSDIPDKEKLMALVKKQNQKIKLNVLALDGHDPGNEKFLKDLAVSTGGQYKFLSEEDLKKK